MITIRPELPTDETAVYTINASAFRTPAEAELVNTLRRRQAVLLSLVADLDGALVGHVLFTPGMIVGENGRFPAAALGPVAVLPAHQRHGIGARLIRAGLESLRRAGHARAFVLGHPAYYPRFGFTPAANYNIICAFDVPPEAFMVMPLHPHALDNITGTAHYLPEFATV